MPSSPPWPRPSNGRSWRAPGWPLPRTGVCRRHPRQSARPAHCAVADRVGRGRRCPRPAGGCGPDRADQVRDRSAGAALARMLGPQHGRGHDRAGRLGDRTAGGRPRQPRRSRVGLGRPAGLGGGRGRPSRLRRPDRVRHPERTARPRLRGRPGRVLGRLRRRRWVSGGGARGGARPVRAIRSSGGLRRQPSQPTRRHVGEDARACGRGPRGTCWRGSPQGP